MQIQLDSLQPSLSYSSEQPADSKEFSQFLDKEKQNFDTHQSNTSKENSLSDSNNLLDSNNDKLSKKTNAKDAENKALENDVDKNLNLKISEDNLTVNSQASMLAKDLIQLDASESMSDLSLNESLNLEDNILIDGQLNNTESIDIDTRDEESSSLVSIDEKYAENDLINLDPALKSTELFTNESLLETDKNYFINTPPAELNTNPMIQTLNSKNAIEDNLESIIDSNKSYNSTKETTSLDIKSTMNGLNQTIESQHLIQDDANTKSFNAMTDASKDILKNQVNNTLGEQSLTDEKTLNSNNLNSNNRSEMKILETQTLKMNHQITNEIKTLPKIDAITAQIDEMNDETFKLNPLNDLDGTPSLTTAHKNSLMSEHIKSTLAEQTQFVSVTKTIKDPDWSNKIFERVQWMANADKHSAEIRIDPPDLGPIKVSLNIKGDHAQVIFTSHSSQVKDLIEQNLDRLKDVLTGDGFKYVDARSEHESRDEKGSSSERQTHGKYALGDSENGIEEEKQIIKVHTLAKAVIDCYI